MVFFRKFVVIIFVFWFFGCGRIVFYVGGVVMIYIIVFVVGFLFRFSSVRVGYDYLFFIEV